VKEKEVLGAKEGPERENLRTARAEESRRNAGGPVRKLSRKLGPHQGSKEKESEGGTNEKGRSGAIGKLFPETVQAISHHKKKRGSRRGKKYNHIGNR